ncbi:MAG: methyltransferase [Bacteriovoracaceae bacterium]|nr:methyltransferase [Bacteriovoracaceae bacterium]
MNLPKDYLQPEFFRFGWDQVFFVENVAQLTKFKENCHLVELGAGSGVISCELSKKIQIESCDLLEFQKEEWESYLIPNLEHQSSIKNPRFHWGKVSEFNLDCSIKADLVVCNPPYFVPRDGRASADPRRNIAHRFVIDSWQDWIDAMVRTLKPDGEAFWLHRDPGPSGKPIFPEGYDWQHVVRSSRMRIIRLGHL